MKKLPWGDLALWLVTAFLVYVFVRQGLAKFSDSSGWARAFTVWHYPVWFRILIGGCETAASLLLLTRRTASIGAAMIAVVMLGGMGTHIWWGAPASGDERGGPSHSVARCARRTLEALRGVGSPPARSRSCMTRIAESQVADLVRRARDSRASIREQHAAFAMLVERFEEMAFMTALGACEDVESARDACQEAFLLAWREAPRCAGSGGVCRLAQAPRANPMRARATSRRRGRIQRPGSP